MTRAHPGAGGDEQGDRPEAIVFDLYGTILDVTGLAASVAAALPGGPARELVSLWRQKQLEYTWLRSLTGHHADFWQVTGDALDHTARRLDLDIATVRERLMDGWLRLSPYPDVMPGLDAIGSLPLAILSNGSAAMLEEGLRHARLRGAFQHVISVDEAAIFKPHPRVYELAERHLGLPRASMLFVSGNDWDARGATLAGWRVARVDRVAAPEESLPGRPERSVADLIGLASWLRRG
ncbi:MAG: haloacid dehalogenase type II [Candidatus Limnocylindrales bacterium]